jgi:hypothetical protein
MLTSSFMKPAICWVLWITIPILKSGYDAVGKVDMMSNNINDHNPYTKLIYGWVKPYIVYGNATITIKSCQWPNTMIIYGYDDKKYSKDS